MNNPASFIPPKAGMDFIAVAGGPTVAAAGEHANYQSKLNEREEMHSPMSLYEMETMENPHTFQRQIMSKLFTRHPGAAITSRGSEGQVKLFRRMTDSIFGGEGTGEDAAAGGAPQVNFLRRMTDSMTEVMLTARETARDAAFGDGEEK